MNEYKEDTEYNIDLCSLHNIKAELIELNNMIGINNMKQSITEQLIYFIQELHVGVNTSEFKHTIIYGPPGTGKTEIAKIIGKMYSKLGILKNNIFKKVTRNDLIAGYLGQTAIKTKKVIQQALGGVLFIDEAYSLGGENSDNYSKECLDTLCHELSEYKDELMVIIAGYENELNKYFFSKNKGLDSRFVWRFEIDSYSYKELMYIFIKKINDIGWKVDEDNKINEEWFKTKMSYFKNYGRDMEILLLKTKIVHSKRVFGKPDLLKKITLEDLNNGFELYKDNSEVKKEIPSFYC
jgi:SpoVK/Ycf46/Vps4 family AAA+-type ATPase